MFTNVRVLSVLILVVFTSTASAVSFDCQKAKSFVEKAICQDQELSALDDELGSLYQNAEARSKNPKKLKQQQLKWLDQRDACQTNGCVKKAYQKRIIDLTPEEE